MKPRSRSTRNRPTPVAAGETDPGGESGDRFAAAEPRALSHEPAIEPPAAMVNPVRDMRRLHRHAGASAAELRHFLAQLRGKSPAEMLGAVASSNLMRGTVIAAAGTAALLLLATAVPYAMSGRDEGGTTAAGGDSVGQNEAAGPVGNGSPAAGAAAADPADEAGPPDPLASDPERVDPARAAQALGVDEERHAPADVNPLENAVDDLLRDLE